MKIVADENIIFLDRFFGDIGDIKALPGREITADDLVDADVLLVRSVTAVNEALLANSSVRFVGSCTIGMDHIDLDYLKSRNIAVANAPGSNANSVVEYVLSCLSILTETHNFDWRAQKVGIVGYGNVGSLLAKRLAKIGVACCAYDPFVEVTPESNDVLCSFEEVMACDVISLHVPLTTDGPHPTHYMLNTDTLAQLSDQQILINTSRGAVIDNQALKAKLIDQARFTAILDVWENEPLIDQQLARLVFLGSPHIAGYSFDGKVAGTEMIYNSMCQVMGLPARHKAGQFLEEPPLAKMAFTSTADADWSIHTAIRACFDVRHDHSQLRSVVEQDDSARAAAFDSFRKNYRCRREFSGVKVQLKQSEPELHRMFRGLGFNLK